jgi:hypothetical protein
MYKMPVYMAEICSTYVQKNIKTLLKKFGGEIWVSVQLF